MKVLFMKSMWDSKYTTKIWNELGVTVQHKMFYGDTVTMFFCWSMLADTFV